MCDCEKQVRFCTPVLEPQYESDGCADPQPLLSDARSQLQRLHALTGAVRGTIARLEV